MNQQLQAVANGLATVTNKVAYMEANGNDSDYVDGDDEEELDDIQTDANQFYIGEGGGGAPMEAVGRGRRRRAGNAADIVGKTRH